MLPNQNEEIKSQLLDASKAFKRIAKALRVERTLPFTSSGWEALASLVEYALRLPLRGDDLQAHLIDLGVTLCKTCRGLGQMFDVEDEEMIDCNSCAGSGRN